MTEAFISISKIKGEQNWSEMAFQCCTGQISEMRDGVIGVTHLELPASPEKPPASHSYFQGNEIAHTDTRDL